jgi:hypothetical protein
MLDEVVLLNTIQKLQAGSLQQVLLAAITRKTMKVVSYDGNPYLTEHDGSFEEFVDSIYMHFKRGNIEPQEPFMKVSKRFDQQHLLNCDIKPIFDQSPHTSSKGCVLACDFTFEKEPNYCAYLTTDGSCLPTRQDLSAIVRDAFETRDIYHTVRNHRTHKDIVNKLRLNKLRLNKLRLNKLRLNKLRLNKLRSNKLRSNLEATYGVHSGGFGFLRLLAKLESKTPVTQGSSRDLSECGSQLYERNMWLYSDNSIYEPQSRMFILYKIFSREISFWRDVARDRRAQGLFCCKCCAAIGEHDICQACNLVLQDPNRYQWFKDCLVGKPFTITALNKSKLKKRQDRLRSQLFKAISLALQTGGPLQISDNEWALNLDFYPQLDDPFKDIGQLYSQYEDFIRFCLQSTSSGDYSENLKRKREEA